MQIHSFSQCFGASVGASAGAQAGGVFGGGGAVDHVGPAA